MKLLVYDQPSNHGDGHFDVMPALNTRLIGRPPVQVRAGTGFVKHFQGVFCMVGERAGIVAVHENQS